MTMSRSTSNVVFSTLLVMSGCLAFTVWAPTPASAASTIFYCPDRKADQQYSSREGPGCVPLVEKEDPNADLQPREPRESGDLKIDNLQSDVSQFLKKYREFLECCKTNIGELRQIEELGEDVSELLASTQAKLSNQSMVSRGIMLREMITPVTKARTDLKKLRARLEKINDASARRDTLSFDEAGHEAERVRSLEESIERDIQAPKLPGSAKTGTSIGVAPAAGPGIGRSSKTGADIGREGQTGQDIGASPKSSSAIGGSGPTGFEIGATGRAGPAIGQSRLNEDSSSNVGSSLQRSTVGSSLSDSTVGSSLGTSAVGSSLQDTSVGSSFGGSSVGSSLQDR